MLPDSKADMLLLGNAERSLVDLTHRLAAVENIRDIKDLRGTAPTGQNRLRPGRGHPGTVGKVCRQAPASGTGPAWAGQYALQHGDLRRIAHFCGNGVTSY